MNVFQSSLHQYSSSRQPPSAHYPPHSVDLNDRERRAQAYSWLTSGGSSQTRGRPPARSSDLQQQQSHPPQHQRSPSQEQQGAAGGAASQGRSYFPSWRTLSSYASSFQSPISLRRLRTASTDRSGAFDTARRFQPSYRSWNERDNSGAGAGPGGGAAGPGASGGGGSGPSTGSYFSLRR